MWGGYSDDLPAVHNSVEKRRVTSHVHVFDITTGKWKNQSTRGTPPLGVGGCLCTSANGKIYYFGGYCGHDSCFHNSLNELNISTFTWTQLQPTDDSITVMRRACGFMMLIEQAGQHCLLLIGGAGPLPSKQLPQAQYFRLTYGGISTSEQELAYGGVSTNEHNIYDLTTGNNINISYYTIRYHL